MPSDIGQPHSAIILMTAPTNTDPTLRSEESPVWAGSPSQWLNAGWFALCTLGAIAFFVAGLMAGQPIVALGALFPIGYAVAKALRVRTTRIEVTTERISTTVGILSRHKWDIELYRVKDTTLHEPFLLRLVRRANIRIISSDRSTPSVTLPALPDAEWLRQQIRTNVERLRLKRGVREMDIEH
jgi:membrane protein YdbS with pleckstrin-like domain